MTTEPNSARRLSDVLSTLTPEDREAIHAWERMITRDGESLLSANVLARSHERSETPRPDNGYQNEITTVGIVGGGTAGYFMALALRQVRPDLKVTVIESSAIPPIGVGEATVPSILPFLHIFLGIEPSELYRAVRPTWKMGIKFDWGPRPAGFMAPFDWHSNSIGVLGSLREHGHIDAFTFQSLLMRSQRVPIFRGANAHESLMHTIPYAYHLDNQSFVEFLKNRALASGIKHIDANIADVALAGVDWVEYIVTTDRQRLEFDVYVDCTGFRSLLIDGALKTPFISFASSLFTDAAVIGNVEKQGGISPYTTATTMSAGWAWTIPMRDEDHVGYVFSSAAASDTEASDELARTFPCVRPDRVVRFSSGRRVDAWRGNVMAVGNSYGFVEPLESTALHMITVTVMTLAAAMPHSWRGPCARAAVNDGIGKRWDEIRWFLSLHYRFNTRLDTPFWREATCSTDVSGLQPLLDVFSDGAPLLQRDSMTRALLVKTAPTLYGLEGIDCLLLGQDVPTRLFSSREDHGLWRARKAGADALICTAMEQREALAYVENDNDAMRAIMDSPDSWLTRSGM